MGCGQVEPESMHEGANAAEGGEGAIEVDAEGEAAGGRGGVADFAQEEIVLNLEFH